jgi:hypothetical protein
MSITFSWADNRTLKRHGPVTVEWGPGALPGNVGEAA